MCSYGMVKPGTASDPFFNAVAPPAPKPKPAPAIENLVLALGIRLFCYVAAPKSLRFLAKRLFFA
jgi:hypothetical protein